MRASGPSREGWLSGMVAPTVMLWTWGGVAGLLSLVPPELPPNAGLLRVAFSVAITAWVMADVRKHRRDVPYDYETFVFFAWPLVVPVHLWRTRRWRALLTFVWFVLLLAVSMIGDVLGWQMVGENWE